MTIRFNPRWLIVLSLVFALQVCRAQVVIPPVVAFNLGGTNNPDSQLWDLQGAYTLNLNVQERNGLVLPVSLSFVLLQDANGRLSSDTNDNTESLVVNDTSGFAILPRVTGKVTGSGGIASVQLSVRFSGQGQVGGTGPVVPVSGSFSISAETDPTTGDLVATRNGKFSVNIAGEGSASGLVLENDFDTPTPNGANSGWTLSMQILGLKRLAGSATIATPSRTFGYDLSGKYNGIFNISAKGANDVQDTLNGAGSSAKIQMVSTFDSLSFKGKVLGQNLLFSAFPN